MINLPMKLDLENVLDISPSLIEAMFETSSEIIDTNSSNEKKRVLKDLIITLKKDELSQLKSLLRLMHNDFYRYGVTLSYINKRRAELFGEDAVPSMQELNGYSFFKQAITLLIRFLEGAMSKYDFVDAMLAYEHTNGDYQSNDLLYSIIGRDWGVKLGATTYNSVFKEKFIPIYSVTKAKEISIEDLDSIGEPGDNFFIEIKYDGTRDITIVPRDCNSEHDIYTLSSNGRVLYIPEVQKDLYNYLVETDFRYTGFIIDGELTVKDSVLKTDRGAITGVHNSAIKLAEGMNSKLAPDWSSRVSYNVFDTIGLDDFESGTFTEDTLKERKAQLESMVQAVEMNCIKIAQYAYCSYEDLNEKTVKAFDEILSLGGEGLIVKDALSSYSFDRDNSYWYKIKPNHTADLRVIGYQLSEDPLLYGALGALICQTECGTITVEVGSGFSIMDRGYYRRSYEDGSFTYAPIPNYNIENWIGKIIEAKYFSVTHTKTKDNNSLFLPRVELIENRVKYETDYMSGELCAGIVRYDKDKANLASELVGYR